MSARWLYADVPFSPPTRTDLFIVRGDTERLSLQIFATNNGPVQDVTGWSFLAQIRDTPGGTVLASATITIVDALQGLVDVNWSAAQTASLPVPPTQKYLSYDVQYTTVAGDVQTFLLGNVFVVADTSRTP